MDTITIARRFFAPNGTLINVFTDGTKEFVKITTIAKALGYAGFNFQDSLLNVIFKNHQFTLYTKAIKSRRGCGATYLIEYNQLIPYLEAFIKLTLVVTPASKRHALFRDNARMEAQKLIELLSPEKASCTTLSSELVTYLEKEYDDYPVKVTELSSGVFKALSSLEKECGSQNVINAIRKESRISPCGVAEYLAGDGSVRGDWGYVCDFARHPNEHNVAKPAEVIKSYHHDYTDADIDFYVTAHSCILIPLMDLANGISGNYGDYAINCVKDAAYEAHVNIKVIQIKCGNFIDCYYVDDVFKILDKYASLPTTSSGEAWNALDLWDSIEKTLLQIRADFFCSPTKEETKMETSVTTTAENNVHVVSVEDIKDIGERVKETITVFRVSEKDALRAITKIKAEEINRDLSPLIELLD